MAIEKIKKTAKLEATPMAYVQFGIAMAMVVISFVFGWQAFSKWQFKQHLLEGYVTYDTNQQGLSKPALQAALGWNPLHAGARELLAKLNCDSGDLDQAEQELQNLLSQGYDRPQVHASLGVVLLKRAAKAAVPAEAAKFVTQAQAEFGKAGAIPEASIGRGHAELLLASKGDASRYAQARVIFEKIRADLGNRAFREQCTREGLVDYYAGLGKVLAMTGKYEPGSAAAFRSCFQYAPGWVLPMTNILRVEAQRYSESNYTPTEMLAMRADSDDLRTSTEQQWKKDPRFKELMEPWMTYALAQVYALYRSGLVNEYEGLVLAITGALRDQYLEPYVLAALVRTSQVTAPEVIGQLFEVRLHYAIQAYEALLSKPAINEDFHKALRASALSNMAYMEITRGVLTELAQLRMSAVTHAEAAADLFPNDYTYNRNVVVVMRHAGRPQAALKKYLDRLKDSPKGPGDDEDFRQIMNLVSGSP